MTSIKKNLASMMALAAVVVLTLTACDSANDVPKSDFTANGLRQGYLAPDVEGSDLEGNPMKLSDFRGKVVVLEFWAST